MYYVCVCQCQWSTLANQPLATASRTSKDIEMFSRVLLSFTRSPGSSVMKHSIADILAKFCLVVSPMFIKLAWNICRSLANFWNSWLVSQNPLHCIICWYSSVQWRYAGQQYVALLSTVVTGWSHHEHCVVCVSMMKNGQSPGICQLGIESRGTIALGALTRQAASLRTGMGEAWQKMLWRMIKASTPLPARSCRYKVMGSMMSVGLMTNQVLVDSTCSNFCCYFIQCRRLCSNYLYMLWDH